MKFWFAKKDEDFTSNGQLCIWPFKVTGLRFLNASFLSLVIAGQCEVARQEMDLRDGEDRLHWWGVRSSQETEGEDPPTHRELGQILQ